MARQLNWKKLDKPDKTEEEIMEGLQDIAMFLVGLNEDAEHDRRVREEMEIEANSEGLTYKKPEPKKKLKLAVAVPRHKR